MGEDWSVTLPNEALELITAWRMGDSPRATGIQRGSILELLESIEPVAASSPRLRVRTADEPIDELFAQYEQKVAAGVTVPAEEAAANLQGCCRTVRVHVARAEFRRAWQQAGLTQ